jgi:uncharacterized membrane protein YfcA
MELKNIKNIVNNTSGQMTSSIIAGVVTLGIVGIIMGVMVMIYANVEPNIVGTSDASNATIAKVNGNVYQGFDLGSISPLIMGAALVITIVLSMVGAFMVRRSEE